MQRIHRWGLVAACSFAVSGSFVSAADFLIDTINDSGPGSLRLALTGAQTGDTLQFQPILNGATMINGGALTISHSVTFLDSNGITLIDGHTLYLPDATSGTTTTLNPLTVNWAGTLTLNGVLSDTTFEGSLIKSGLGTLILTNANTYSGGTTISAGTLNLTNSSAIGTGALTVSNVAGTKVLTLGNSVNLANSITLGSALTVNTAAGTSSQLSGIISGTAATDSLIQTGTGTLILTSANTFAGGVAVTGNGTINLQNNTGLGTGTLSETSGLTLILASGVSANNAISLGGQLTANVASGTSALTGAISQTSASEIVKTGSGTLILSGVNSYTGGVLISQGTLQGNASGIVGNVTDNAALIFSQTGIGTYAGNLSGTGSLTVTGTGTLIFSGTTSLPATTKISSGELQVTGTVTGPVSVNSSSAELSGSGSVGSVTNDGYVQPGTTSGGALNTIGTLNVTGSYTQPSDGTTQIKINSTGNTAGVNNDYLTVSGQTTLSGYLNVIPTGGGAFTPGTPYTIINSTGGVSGQFAQAWSTSPAYGVDVTYGANTVTFDLQPVTSLKVAAQTSNQTSVGTLLDQVAASGTGTIYPLVNSLGVQSTAVQRQAMNQLSGEMYGNLQSLGLEIGNQFQQRVTSALVSNAEFLTGDQSIDSGARGQSSGVTSSRIWSQGYGFGGAFRSDGNAGTLNFGQGGGIMGFEIADDSARVGVVGGAGYGGFNDSFGGGGQVTSYQLGAYTLIDDDASYMLASANYGFNEYYTHRTISTTGVSRQYLRADYTGNQIGANFETGLKWAVGWLHIQPLVGLQYLYLCQQGFEESGGTADLNGPRTRASSLRASIGLRAATNSFEGRNGAIWTPFTHVRFVGDLLDNNRFMNASFAGSPLGTTFVSQGTRIGQTYGLLGQGVEVRLNSVWSLFGGAEATVGERTLIGTGSVGAVSLW